MRQFVIFMGLSFSSAVIASTPVSKVTTEDLSWMSGHWVASDSDGDSEEVIGDPKSGLILGFSRMDDANGIQFYEFMRFEDSLEGVVLTPYPNGVRGVSFPLESFGVQMATFVNSANMFPSSILYELVDTDNLRAVVSGLQGGQKIVMELNFKRAK